MINTSRGEVIDETDLADALESGALHGAALDVLTQEPPGKDHVFHRMEDRLPGVIITPHLAVGRETVQLMVNTAVEDIVRVLTGRQPLYPINGGRARPRELRAEADLPRGLAAID